MTARALAFFFLACTLTGCSLSGEPLRPDASPLSNQILASPHVVQKGKGAQWVGFKPHTTSGLYSAMALGPDGNVWFIDENAAGLVRISTSGSIKEFPLSGIITGNAVSMAVGADKKFYLLDESANVVRVTRSGSAQSFPIPSGDNTAIDGLGLGPDGNVWFAEFNHIGKTTPSGTITEFAYPSGYSTNQYGGVTGGSDGNVWFAQSSANAIGRIVPSTGKITMFPIGVGCTPAPVVLAAEPSTATKPSSSARAAPTASRGARAETTGRYFGSTRSRTP